MRMNQKRNPDDESELPAGTPSWITRRLIKLTLKIWQPRYKTLLTREDAITMLAGVGRLFDLLVARDTS
jgi:hypothetical protein